MTTAELELNTLRNQLADHIDEHPLQEWGPALLSAVVAVMDLHFAEGGTNKAPVLTLVKR